MKCPNCDETKVTWTTKYWGNREPEFWSARQKVLFLCGGKYIYDEDNGTYEEINPCRNKK